MIRFFFLRATLWVIQDTISCQQASQVSSQISEVFEKTSLFCDSASENCDNASRTSISLALLEDEQSFESLENLILKINEHAESRDYAIVLDQIKKFKLDVRKKT
jgi:KaiC/GvpD/RAD55 family RecA-like ATPase